MFLRCGGSEVKEDSGEKRKQKQKSPFFMHAQGWWYWPKVMAKICRRARSGWGQPAVNLGWKRIPGPGTGPAWGVRKPFPPQQSVVPRPATVPVPRLRPWLSGEHAPGGWGLATSPLRPALPMRPTHWTAGCWRLLFKTACCLHGYCCQLSSFLLVFFLT